MLMSERLCNLCTKLRFESCWFLSEQNTIIDNHEQLFQKFDYDPTEVPFSELPWEGKEVVLYTSYRIQEARKIAEENACPNFNTSLPFRGRKGT